MTTTRWRQTIAKLHRTPTLLILQKLLRQVPFRPVDVGKLCFLRFEGLPVVAPAMLRGPAIVRRGVAEDVDGLARLRDLKDEFLERFAAGDHCVVAEVGGRIVGFEWFCDQPRHRETAWGYPVEVPDGFIYAYDAFLDPSSRNTGIWLRFKAYLAELMVQTGRRGVLTFIEYGNSASYKAHIRFGFKPSATVLVIKALGKLIALDLASRSSSPHCHIGNHGDNHICPRINDDEIPAGEVPAVVRRESRLAGPEAVPASSPAWGGVHGCAEGVPRHAPASTGGAEAESENETEAARCNSSWAMTRT